ncbi:MAG: GNAT family N-acetyltransferase [Cyanobacteria bacterium P01_D01_bin.105]
MTVSQKITSETGPNFTIRTMRRDELAISVEWAAAEGWNPGLHDASCFYAADEGGFLIGLLDGEPMASISVVKYESAFAFLGFYIVRSGFRGRGYGRKIWQAGLERLKGCNVGLDGVVEQQGNYLKSGFKLAHRNIRYEGVANSEKRPVSMKGASMKETDDGEIVDLASVSVKEITAYDKAVFLYERSPFLRCWISSPHHYALGVMHQGALAGYGVLRPCQKGYKIGPLFADSAQFAEALFLALTAYVEPENSFYLDVPSVNKAAVTLAEKYEMKSVFETARMYTQKAPDLPLNRIFGITTFELG